MKLSVLNFLLVVGLFAVTSVSQAQTDLEKHIFWISPTVGKATFPSAMLSVGYEPATSQSVFVGRYTVNAELFPDEEPGIKLQELGLLYGRRIGNVRVVAGLASIWGNYRGAYIQTDPDPLTGNGREYEFVSYKTWGIPAEVRYMLTSKYVGIGLTAFGTLNQKRSFGGLGVSFYLGKMK